MLSRVIRLLLVFLSIGLAVTVIVLNKHEISIFYMPGKTTGPVMAGVVLLATFCTGIAVTVLFSLIYGVKAYFRERSLKHRESKMHEFYRLMLDARNAQAAGEFEQAQERWERLIHRDPTDVIARIELSRSLELAGHAREALKVLDKARAADPSNTEVLLRAAELNIKLNNKTAAIDNLALLVFDHPNRRAAKLARNLSEDLGRIEDAVEYDKRYRSLGGRDKETSRRLELKRILSAQEENDRQLAQLRKFVKKNPEYGPALSQLAHHEAQDGNIETAAELLLKAARQSESREYWLEATRLWLDNDQGERAIAAAKTATRNASGLSRLQSELDLIRLHLDVHQADQAKELLNEFERLAREEKVSISQKLKRQFLTLTGLCLNQLGDYQGAAGIWQQLIKEEELPSSGSGGGPTSAGSNGSSGSDISTTSGNTATGSSKHQTTPRNGATPAPSPTLSTP